MFPFFGTWIKSENKKEAITKKIRRPQNRKN
jgi:hypothetical protein